MYRFDPSSQPNPIPMKINKRHLAVLAGLVLLPCTAALAVSGGGETGPLSNSTLDARHPSSLAGRGQHKQTGYVDLYAPLTESEARRVSGYRGADGQRLSTPAQER